MTEQDRLYAKRRTRKQVLGTCCFKKTWIHLTLLIGSREAADTELSKTVVGLYR